MSQTGFVPTPEVEEYVDCALKLAADACYVHKWGVLSGAKSRKFSNARRIFVAAMRATTDATYPQLASILGRDHSGLVINQRKKSKHQDKIDWVCLKLVERWPNGVKWPTDENGLNGSVPISTFIKDSIKREAALRIAAEA